MGTSGEATALADAYLLLRESKPSASVALACMPRLSPAAGTVHISSVDTVCYSNICVIKTGLEIIVPLFSASI